MPTIAEIDPDSLRRHLRPAAAIGGVSFLAPFLGAAAFAYWVGDWDRQASWIAGIALSTTEHRYFRQIQHEARRQFAARGVSVRLEVVPGHPAQVLARLADERGCDLVVLGHTGHSRLHHLFLGSTADRVVERAHCAVLVVR